MVLPMLPKTIRYATILFILSIIAALISAYIDYQNTPQAFARQVILFMVLVFVVPSAIIFAYILRRRNWARITWLVIFVLGSVLMLLNHHQAHYVHMSLRYFAMLQVLLQIAITLLLFLPPSNSWFRQTGFQPDRRE